MNSPYLARTWLPMLLAGVFALCHGGSVRPRVLLVERLGTVRALVAGRCPRPGAC